MKKTYDVIIIGGGIAGLTVAYQLTKTFPFPRVLLLEKTSRFGGKIDTWESNQGDTFELCPSRISFEVHKQFLDLIQELGFDLKKDLKPVSSQIEYALRSSYNNELTLSSQGKRYKLSLLESLLTHFNRHLYSLGGKVGQLLPNSYLQSRTPKEFLHSFGFSSEFIAFLQDGFGYDSPWDSINLKDGFRDISYYFPSKGFFTFTPGLLQIIDRLVSVLQTKCDLQFNSPVTSWAKEQDCGYIVSCRYHTFYTRSIVFAIPFGELIHLLSFPLLYTVTPIALMRIFLFYKKEHSAWIQSLPHHLITETPVRMLIKESPNLLQIYVDQPFAYFWHHQTNLRHTIWSHLKQIFPNWAVPPPDLILPHFVPEAVHYWKKGVDSEKVIPKMIHPFPEENLFFCGESYSLHQGWMEGAVETANWVSRKWKSL